VTACSKVTRCPVTGTGVCVTWALHLGEHSHKIIVHQSTIEEESSRSVLKWELLGLCIYHPSVSLESATSSSQARDKDRSSPFLPRTVINLSAKVVAGTKDTKRHWGKGFACTGRSKECTKVEICVLSCSWILQEETPRRTTKERKYPPEAGNNYYWEKMKQI